VVGASVLPPLFTEKNSKDLFPCSADWTHGLPLFYVEYNSPRRCGISAVRNSLFFRALRQLCQKSRRANHLYGVKFLSSL